MLNERAIALPRVDMTSDRGGRFRKDSLSLGQIDCNEERDPLREASIDLLTCEPLDVLRAHLKASYSELLSLDEQRGRGSGSGSGNETREEVEGSL